VVKEGIEDCPTGWDERIQAFDKFEDKRVCTGCGCKMSKVTCSGGAYTAFDLNDCGTGNGGPVTIDYECGDISDLLDGKSFGLAPTLDTPSGDPCNESVPRGAVEKSGPMTFCCKA
jgi:hypothetical protein